MITAKLSVNDMTRIPKKVRQDLKLNQGDRIVFEKNGDEYSIRKLIEESQEPRNVIPASSDGKNSWESE